MYKTTNTHTHAYNHFIENQWREVEKCEKEMEVIVRMCTRQIHFLAERRKTVLCEFVSMWINFSIKCRIWDESAVFGYT